MSKIDPHIFSRITKKATQSICRFKVAALGFNKAGVCVMARTNGFRFSHPGGGFHAEALIMAQAKKKGIEKILICRIGNSGDILPIDPCDRCQALADKLEIVIDTIPVE